MENKDKIQKLKDIVIYDLNEIQELLEVTQRTLYTYIKDGKLKAQKIGGRWKVTEENLKSFLNGN